MGLTVAQRNAILNQVFRNTDYTAYANLYMSLHTADPGDNGASEATGGSYARKAITFAAASNGKVESAGAVTYDGMPAAMITHFGIWSAASGGTFLGGGPLAASKTTTAGDTLNFAAGEVDWDMT